MFNILLRGFNTSQTDQIRYLNTWVADCSETKEK